MTRTRFRLKARLRLARIRYTFSAVRVSEITRGIILAVLVGLASGIGAVIFKYLIGTFHTFFFTGGSVAFSGIGRYYVLFIPVIGGLAVGLLIRFLTGKAKDHGVSEVMIAVNARGGRMARWSAAVQTVASAVCIGSGGSVGLHGPAVYLGSAFGSALGQWGRMREDWVKLLVACGAAGGISATFNAPIAGIFFSLELILRRLSARNFILVGLSSIGASYVARIFFGSSPIFSLVPDYAWTSGWEILFYVMLGIVSAFVGVVFMLLLYKCEDIFGSWKFPSFLKPAVGGLFIGLIGLFYPYLFGVGYEGAELAILGSFGVTTLVIMGLLKVLATSITLGSGGRGGIFAPSLFMGAMLGTAFGIGIQSAFPSLVPNPGAYGLVGMGAVFAAVSFAPITAILILFEITQDYLIILPLIAAVVTSTYIAQRIKRDSIYSMKVRQQGVEILEGELDPLRTSTVGGIMTRNFPTVTLDMPITELLHEMERTGHHGFPAVDTNGRLFGVVTLSDVERGIKEGKANLSVRDIATRNPVTAYPDEKVRTVLARFATMDVGRIPVVSRKDSTLLLGCLRRHDIIRAYTKALLAGREDEL